MDNHFPEIVDMPGNISTVTDPGTCTTVVEWVEPTSADDCGISSFLSSHQSGEVFSVGSTEVTYTVSDSSGLIVTDTFTINVEDNQSPEFASAPSTMSLGNDPDLCGAIVTWVDPVVEDNCAIDSISYTHDSGSLFAVGTTAVTITAP